MFTRTRLLTSALLATSVLLAGAATIPPAYAAPSATPGVTPAAAGAAYSVSRVSLGDRGTEATNGVRFPERPSISADGRYVAFVSLSPDLVVGDTNGAPDVFVRDRLAGTTVRVSVAADDSQIRGTSNDQRISADGRRVVFTTAAALVPADTNRQSDVYVRDLSTGTTTLVSARPDGHAADHGGFFGSLSRTGRYVTFQSSSTNLVAGDTNGVEDVFVRDLVAGVTTRVSLIPRGFGRYAAGFEPRISLDGTVVLFGSLNGDGSVTLWQRDRVRDTTTRLPLTIPKGRVLSSWNVSGDGRFVVFTTDAVLVRSDTNAAFDAYRLDTRTGHVVRVSVGTRGQQAAGGSEVVEISSDGSVAVFTTASDGVVPGDTNGVADVFRRDITAGTTTRVSTSTAGAQGNAESGYTKDVSLSADGRHVAFVSFASNLVPRDTNADPDAFVWDLAGSR